MLKLGLKSWLHAESEEVVEIQHEVICAAEN
jgi:hypothetical protein